MNTWMSKWMEDSSQTPFHYSWDEYERVGAYGIVCVCRHTHPCSSWSCVACVCVPLGTYVICVHHCICVFLCVLVVCFACVGVGELLLWQLPAAKGLERWHHWNGADLFVSARMCLCYSVVVSAMNRMRVVCVSSLKGNWIRLQRIWHQLNSNPHKRGKKWKKIKRECS